MSKENEMTYLEFVESVADTMIDFAKNKEVDYAWLDCQMSMIIKDIRDKYEEK